VGVSKNSKKVDKTLRLAKENLRRAEVKFRVIIKNVYSKTEAVRKAHRAVIKAISEEKKAFRAWRKAVNNLFEARTKRRRGWVDADYVERARKRSKKASVEYKHSKLKTSKMRKILKSKKEDLKRAVNADKKTAALYEKMATAHLRAVVIKEINKYRKR